MINVLVTGGNGQLATSIKDVEKQFSNFKFIYTDLNELDITNLNQVLNFFKENSFDYCINCAAYTAVDKAEKEEQFAEIINATGVDNLAKSCSQNDVILIHISTDFVFDGKKREAYKETDRTNPINVYGQTKLKGEEQIINRIKKYFILRTSWLYCEYGGNFMKTMLNLAKEKSQINVVTDQIGTPTYAKDLVKVIFKIITSNNQDFGVYHYSNQGVASWYDFAEAIFEIKGLDIKVNPIKTSDFPTAARRPIFSVLNKTKIKNKLNIEIPHWRDSLKTAILNYNEQES